MVAAAQVWDRLLALLVHVHITGWKEEEEERGKNETLLYQLVGFFFLTLWTNLADMMESFITRQHNTVRTLQGSTVQDYENYYKKKEIQTECNFARRKEKRKK